jgi:hypothetical protein
MAQYSVMRGLDPRIQPLREVDGLPGIRAFTPVFAGFARQ